MSWSIRPATAADAPSVAGLVAEMGGHCDIAPSVVARNFAGVLDRPELRAIVAVEEGAVVGYAEVHARLSTLHGCREGWVAALVVVAERRRQGVGRDLLEALEREAALLGCGAIVLESSEWRCDSHLFYRSQGFEDMAPAYRFRRSVAGAAPGIADRFLLLAARAASAVDVAIRGLESHRAIALGADGAPTEAADRAAELAAVEILSGLGVPLVSEESGLIGPEPPSPGEPWICIDPLDGSRNFRAGLAPYATSFGLVLDGEPIAGYVADLSSGRRWWAARGAGAWVDGVPARPRSGPIAVRPSPEPGSTVAAVDGYQRLCISGSTTVDLCGSRMVRWVPSSTSTVASYTCTTWPVRWRCCARRGPAS